MSENIDIKIREDGSRTVARDLKTVAEASAKADKSVKGLNKSLDDTAKSGTSLERLKAMVHQIDSFNSTMVDRFGKNLTQYRTTLMKHFEMVSREAKSSAALIKSQMEVITGTPPGLEAISQFYREQEALHKAHVIFLADEMTAQEALEKESSAKRLAVALKGIKDKSKADQSYTQMWSTELDKREALDAKYSQFLKSELKLQEAAELKSYETRLVAATQAITTRMKKESEYTAFWVTELGKRDAAEAASNLRTAKQRSAMQVVNAERLTRQLISPAPGTSDLAKQYAAQDTSRNVGGKSALQLAELQSMQRQMAMMQLMAPMIQRELDMEKESLATASKSIPIKDKLAGTNGKLGEATSKAATHQVHWNNAAYEAHGLARGLSGSLGTLWLTYGSFLPLLAGAAIGSSFVQASKAGAEFAYQLTFVKALGGETTESINKLKESALELSTNSAYKPTEIASGYRILAQAGQTAEESLRTMPEVLNLATAGELSMEQAGIAVVGTLNAFKLGVDQASHVTDLFAKASAASQASVADLTQSMRYGSTVGTQYKQSMDETMAALALLAKVNVTGTSAGTAYRNMLKEIYTPTKDVQKVWTDLGISMEKTVTTVTGEKIQKVKSFVEVINELRKKMNTLDEPSQVRLKGFLGGERGSKEMAAMLDLTEQAWDEFYQKISVKSEGFAKKVAEDVNATAKNQWKEALNNLEAALIDSFTRMEEPLIGLAQQLKTLFASQEFKNTLDTINQAILGTIGFIVKYIDVLYELAKAWLVLKAAQAGAAIASVMLTIGGAARTMAAGMLAASGAMGPVARGATMLGPLLAALGGPLTIILGLLAAGAAAWLLWGRNAETASGKAVKTAQEKLDKLNKEAKYGYGDLGKEREELDRLEQIYELRNKTQGLDRKHVDEARAAYEIQAKLVEKMEEATKLNTPTVVIPKIKQEGNPVGDGVWHPPLKTPGGSGPSGTLNKDDKDLATLKARLEVSKQELVEIEKYGQARFTMNEGQKKALEIQEKMTALEKMSTSELLEKGIKGREAQLTSFKEQLVVATELGKQLKTNALARVDTALEEEVRLVRLLPDLRDTETKYLAFRNQLLKDGVTLEEIDVEKLRQKIAAQIELNKVMAVRDEIVKGTQGEVLKDTGRDIKGIQAAGQEQGVTAGDTNAATMRKMQALGLDMSQTEELRAAQVLQFQTLQLQVDAYRAAELISLETHEMAKHQIENMYLELRMQNARSFFGSLATLSTSANSKIAAVGKAAAITQATMDGYLAIQKALASAPPPVNYALAAAVGVQTAANVAKIAGLQFATGGSFVVGGTGGVDSQNVSFRASPGERVSVQTPTQVKKGTENSNNQQNKSGSSDGERFKILNVLDPNLLQDYLSTPAGEQVLINTIQRNSGAIRNVIQG